MEYMPCLQPKASALRYTFTLLRCAPIVTSFGKKSLVPTMTGGVVLNCPHYRRPQSLRNSALASVFGDLLSEKPSSVNFRSVIVGSRFSSGNLLATLEGSDSVFWATISYDRQR